MKRGIIVKLQVEGLHNWPGCDLPEVEYLAYKHRHIFEILAEFEVTHGDRDLEFIRTKHLIEGYVKGKYYRREYGCCDFGSNSCEHLAEELLKEFDMTKCSVSEDGEFWGVVQK